MQVFNLLFLLVFSLGQVSLVVAEDTPTENPSKPEVVRFPVITEKVDKNLFDADFEKVKKTIEQRKQQITLLSDNLQQKLKEAAISIENLEKQLEKDAKGEVVDNLNNQDILKQIQNFKNQQENLQNIMDNYKDIHYKYVNLLHELDKKEELPDAEIKLQEPYTIFSVIQLNDALQNNINQKILLAERIKQGNTRLAKLADLLAEIMIEYTMELSKPEESTNLYITLRNVYLYQADYAILKLKNNKQQQKLQALEQSIEKAQKLLPKIIADMQVTSDDLQKLGQQLDDFDEKLKKLQSEHSKLNSDFDKISLKAELELDNLEIKINKSKSAQEIEVLQVKKQVNLHKVKYAYFVKNLLQQKERAIQLQRDESEFNLMWLKAYTEKKSKPQAFKSIITASKSKIVAQENMKLENLQLLDSLNRSSLEISSLVQDIALKKESISQKKPEKKSAKQLAKEYTNLLKQLDKSNKTIQKLSLQLNQNNEQLQNTIEKNNRVLQVLSQQFNKIEQIGQWFDTKFKSQLDKIKSILYYPLTSFGDKPFTLAIILKILLYIILGFMFLRFFRSRLAKFLSKRTKLSEGAAFSISTLIYYLGGLLVLLLALSASGFDLGQMMIVFGALGVGIGFGLQNIANNFVSGMILLIDRTLTVGDSITLSDGTHGKVAKLAMRYTVIRTNGGYDIIVPNSELIANRVTSMTFDDNYFRIEIPFGVSYDADPELVREITLEVADKVKHTINRESQKSAVLFSGFGDNSLDFVLRVWVFIYDRYRPYAIQSDYYYKLFKAFKEAGIEIPYPQRDLHVRSMDKKLLKSLQKFDKAKE